MKVIKFQKYTTIPGFFNFLLKIFGLSIKSVALFMFYLGNNPLQNHFSLKYKYFKEVIKIFKKYFIVGKVLKGFIKKKIQLFFKIRLYKGLRHKNKLPCHGQRTHTNAKTRKRFIY